MDEFETATALADRAETFALEMERAKTAVGNGRLFNVLMFFLIVLVAVKINTAALWLAFLPVLSLGAATLADGLARRFNAQLSLASVACAVASLLVIFYL